MVCNYGITLQGYDLDIRHIPEKRNPADSLSRKSIKDALIRKGSVHDANEAYVRQLRIPEEVTETDIQEALNRICDKISISDQSPRSVIGIKNQFKTQFQFKTKPRSVSKDKNKRIKQFFQYLPRGCN